MSGDGLTPEDIEQIEHLAARIRGLEQTNPRAYGRIVAELLADVEDDAREQ